MKRGDVYWVNFDPAIGGEISKTRPAVIVSNTDANNSLNRLVVVPLTGNTSRVFPSETIVFCKHKQSKAVADQMTVVSKQRLGKSICSLTYEEMEKVSDAIRYHLDLVVYH